MDQQQPRGDFAAFLNREKQPGDNRPIFQGHVTKPGATEKFRLTLWAHEYADKATGEIKTMYSGSVGAYAADAEPSAQIGALTRKADQASQALGSLDLRPRQITLFDNGFKADAPDKQRPDLWGGINFGDGTDPVRISAWMQTTRYGEAMLSGATSFPLPGKTEAEMQAAEPELADLIATGKVAKGMPKGKGRGE